MDLHQCLLNTDVLNISIQVCKSGHYLSYVISANAVKFNHGDSMHNSPLTDALQVFQWVFSDIPGFSQERIDSVASQVAHQGHSNGGNSSCGLATFNFAEWHLDPSIPSWSGQHSQVFQDHALHDLLLYHATEKEVSGCILNWVSRYVPIICWSTLMDSVAAMTIISIHQGYVAWITTWWFTY